MNIELNVYNKEGKVTKTVKANYIDLEFGAIRSIMELLNIDSITDTGDLLKTVYSAWDQLTVILTACFADMSYEDWEHVKLKELVPVIFGILKYSFSEILSIPQDPKN